MFTHPPRTAHMVKTADGTLLAVREWGHPHGQPVLFIHGYAQTGLSFVQQVEAPELSHLRLVTFDLRGHGVSDKLLAPESYQTSTRWADDIAALIDQCALPAPILVGWSYGGRIISDYLARYGSERLSGLVFVDAVTENARHFYGACNRLMKLMGDKDPATCIAATRSFQRACTLHPLDPDVFETLLAAAMMCPPEVRAAMARPADYGRVLTDTHLPALVIHGADDAVIAPAMAVHIAGSLPHARLEIMENTGHAPFLERPAAFNALLLDFINHL
ncbi:MAG: alpha/beta hydrolase [Pseudomonadota bacterium]